MDKKIKIYFLYSCKEFEYPNLVDFRINFNKWLGFKEEKISCVFKLPIKLNNEYNLILVCFIINYDIYNKLPNNFYIQLITDRSKYIFIPPNLNDKKNLIYHIEFISQVQFYSDKMNDLPPTYLKFSLYEEIDYLFFYKNNSPKFYENNFLFALMDHFKNYYENDLTLYFTMLKNIIETKNDKLLCQFLDYHFNYTSYFQSNINTFTKIKEIIEYLN